MRQPLSETFKKGKETLKRKAKELSTLCDIPVCVGIVSPEGKTETWPESQSEAKTIFDMYEEKTQTLGLDRHRTKNNVPHSVHEDELMQLLNSKIAAVENRIQVLKKINWKKIEKEGRCIRFDEIDKQRKSGVVALECQQILRISGHDLPSLPRFYFYKDFF